MMNKSFLSRNYTQREVNELFNHVPTRTLLSIAKEDVVEWISEHRDRRGIHRIYNLANLYQIAVVTNLALTGFSYTSIKEILMGPYLKGKDSHGKQNILNYMSKILVIKIGAVKMIDRLSDYAKQRIARSGIVEEVDIHRRIPIYEVLFDSPENISSMFTKLLSDPLNAPPPKENFLSPDMRRQLQPMTVVIINLPELAARLEIEIERLFQRAKITQK